LSVADNSRDAVLLHVSASIERQEKRYETGPKNKGILQKNVHLNEI